MNTPLIEEIEINQPPHLLFKELQKYPYSFFLDSAMGRRKQGRFSFLGCEPFLVFKSKKDSVTLEWNDGKKETLRSDPFLALKELFRRFAIFRAPAPEYGIPFIAGGVGYFGYDMKDFVEKLPDISRDDLSLPDCVIGFYDTVLAFDHLKGKTYLSSVEFSGVKTDAGIKLKDALFAKNIGTKKTAYAPSESSAELKSNFTKAGYIRAVEEAKEYIKRGDIYQVNLSQRFEAGLKGEPYELYLRLRNASPAMFASYLNFEDAIIISSSPERFLMKSGSYIETRPIKGTMPRSNDPLTDELNEISLKESYKDRAEHIMIVDLERNDLGRICEYGSVKPAEFIIMERYSTVFHLVSTVSGRLKEGVGPVDCLTAAFPGGSITGAPKVRSMEVIEALEPVKRSLYTGAIGYISFDGNMDTSIVIRTIVVKGDKLFFSVGGGIVADSDPEKEYYETLDKAEGMLRALNLNSLTTVDLTTVDPGGLRGSKIKVV
ncbi:MAG: aminodeoxychorismate synthase component I [Candidatus Omnitrophica bacterium]|nr:aminodeoxychorismate synthase component I [Candidatus Omnitrophota bacterium]